MRLTLRTLLAYLDDILEPSDKEELSKKIESSEFAEELVHRTKDTMRRLRLSAPQLVGSGMGLDPNSVAEYLDNVMPPDSVGDFERICLESDMHLAEVASCHHVLTMVLGEPADVDLASKQRMYAIPAALEERKRVRIEAAHVPMTSQPLPLATPLGLRPVDPLPVEDQSRVVEIPDYLRASGWSRYFGPMMGLAALLLLGATLFLLSGASDWFGGTDGMSVALNAPVGAQPAPKESAPLGDVSPTGSESVSAPVPSSASAMDANATPLAGGESGGGERYVAPPALGPPQPLTPGLSPLAVAPAASSDQEPDRYAVTADPVAPGETVAPGGTEERAIPSDPAMEDPTASGVAATDAATSSVASASPSVPSPYDVTPTPGGPTVTAPEMPAEGSVNPPAETVAVVTPPQDATSVTGLSSERGDGSPPPVTELPATTEPTEKKKPLDLGTYLGGKTVLLRQNAEGEGWYRVSPREAVMEGERLVSLPEFRPTITLTSGVNLDLSGGTMIGLGTVEAPDGTSSEAGQSAIEVLYGRVVLLNAGSGDNTVRLTLGPTTAEVKLLPKATLGVEVERTYVPGHDPRKSPTPAVVHLYAPNGNVEWKDSAGTQVIEKPSEWTIREGVASAVKDSATIPEWIDQEPVGTLSEQRFGAPVVESTLTGTRPAELQLLELYKGGQRKEVKSLVARSSGHVGLFEPSVDALRDPNQRWPSWEMHVKALRAGMAQSPETASKVWDTLVKQRGETAAADLYEMLCGYSLDQVGSTTDERRTGALARLVDWMGDDNLDYRVLAVYDLDEITGKHPMDPSDRLKERQQTVKRFKARVDSGELKPKE